MTGCALYCTVPKFRALNNCAPSSLDVYCLSYSSERLIVLNVQYESHKLLLRFLALVFVMNIVHTVAPPIILYILDIVIDV